MGQAGGEEGSVGLFLLLVAYFNRMFGGGTGNSRPGLNPPQLNPRNPRNPTPAPVVVPTISPAPTTPEPTATFAPTPRPTPCVAADLFVCENNQRTGDHCGLTFQIFG